VPELKLARLPDRTPAKITITVSSDLNRALNEYAEIYRATYGEAETVAELIPFMLDAFLDSDRGFAKARKTGARDSASPSPVPPLRREMPAAAFGNAKEN
jgi:hypothetical protein